MPIVGGDQKTGKTAAEQAKQEKADRLASALRDNLHRRKAQARARRAPAIDTAGTGMTAPVETDNSPQGDV